MLGLYRAIRKRRAGFGASRSPSTATGTGSTTNIDTNSVTASPIGGVGPFTYSWTFTDNPDSITAVSSTAATTVFRKSSTAPATDYFATAHCTITDTGNGSVTADTPDVPIDIHRT